jgi:hypothetical protein
VSPVPSFQQGTLRRCGATAAPLAAISKRLFELMGGASVMSKLGSGSVFHFTIKAACPRPYGHQTTPLSRASRV